MRIAKALALTLAGSAAALVLALSGTGQGAFADAGPATDGVQLVATPLGDSGWQ
ncbi:hypothetical protein [Streptomyces sp. NPDC047061]|uniref:hypothetical protein n=1 Tax=Streptomyces sp. NPDC047061 TaxID=3154605 RepID=UPI0033E2B648